MLIRLQQTVSLSRTSHLLGGRRIFSALTRARQSTSPYAT